MSKKLLSHEVKRDNNLIEEPPLTEGDDIVNNEKWWYFHIRKIGSTSVISLAYPETFGPRPEGAHPDHGNPYTPWFRAEDHIDDIHIHIKAADETAARAKALYMHSTKYNILPDKENEVWPL